MPSVTVRKESIDFGAREEAESSTTGFEGSRKRETLGMARAFETPKPTPSDTLPLISLHLLILSNSATPRWLSILIDEPF